MSTDLKFPVKLQIGDTVFECEVPQSQLPQPPIGVQFQLGEKEFSAPFKMRNLSYEDDERLVDQLLFGEPLTEKVMLGNKVEVLFQVRTAGSGLDLCVLPVGFKPPPGALARWYEDYQSMRTLAHAIETWDGKPLSDKDPEKDREGHDADKLKFVYTLAPTVVNVLLERWGAFLDRLKRLLNPKVIDPIAKKS